MGTRDDAIGGALAEVNVRRKFYLDTMSITLAGNLTLDAAMPPLLLIDSGGVGRNILMPSGATSRKGQVFWIAAMNAAGTLTIQTSAGGALTPAAAIVPTQMGMFFHDGVSNNWRGMVAAPTQTSP